MSGREERAPLVRCAGCDCGLAAPVDAKRGLCGEGAAAPTLHVGDRIHLIDQPERRGTVSECPAILLGEPLRGWATVRVTPRLDMDLLVQAAGLVRTEGGTT